MHGSDRTGVRCPQEWDSGWEHAWGDIDDDWDEWGGTGARRGPQAGPDVPSSGRRRRQFSRSESRRGPRDAYLRPMIDREGIRQRLTLRPDEGEEELRTEFDINQLESRAAVRFAGVLPPPSSVSCLLGRPCSTRARDAVCHLLLLHCGRYSAALATSMPTASLRRLCSVSTGRHALPVTQLMRASEPEPRDAHTLCHSMVSAA